MPRMGLIQPVLGLRPYALVQIVEEGRAEVQAGGGVEGASPEGLRTLAKATRAAAKGLRREARALAREARRAGRSS